MPPHPWHHDHGPTNARAMLNRSLFLPVNTDESVDKILLPLFLPPSYIASPDSADLVYSYILIVSGSPQKGSPPSYSNPASFLATHSIPPCWQNRCSPLSKLLFLLYICWYSCNWLKITCSKQNNNPLDLKQSYIKTFCLQNTYSKGKLNIYLVQLNIRLEDFRPFIRVSRSGYPLVRPAKRLF